MLLDEIDIQGDEVNKASEADVRARIRGFFAPIAIILTSIPLVLELIPPNRWYGVRVREAYASDAAWYAINRRGSMAIIGACLIWLIAATYVTPKYVSAIGMCLILLTLALMTIFQGWTL